MSEPEPIRFPDGTTRSFGDFVASCPPHAIVELATGRFTGPIVITRPITLRGAGDLTRISAGGKNAVIVVRVPREGRVILESLLLEDGDGPEGGGLSIFEGRVRLHNVHVRHSRTSGGGGAIHLAGGELEATLLRVHDVEADKGGAIWASGRTVLHMRDAQVHRSEARLGGALAVEGAAQIFMESLTIGKARATAPSGGQAIHVTGAGSVKPQVRLRRVRLEDVPMGAPLVIQPAHAGEVTIAECDMPRAVLSAPGVVDAGRNHWR
jgi:hypothetical protein